MGRAEPHKNIFAGYNSFRYRQNILDWTGKIKRVIFYLNNNIVTVVFFKNYGRYIKFRSGGGGQGQTMQTHGLYSKWSRKRAEITISIASLVVNLITVICLFSLSDSLPAEITRGGKMGAIAQPVVKKYAQN